MYNIDVFNNSEIILNRKIPHKIFSWITILIITLLTFLIFLIFFKYEKNINYIGMINDNKLSVYINQSDINTIKNRELLVNNTKTKYNILSISENYIYTNQGEKQHEVIIKINNSFPNGIVEVDFKLFKTTLLKEIVYLIKKG